MIGIKHSHSHEYRAHRFVSPCAPCLLIVWVLAWFAATPLHAGVVALSSNTTIAQIEFAVTELRAALDQYNNPVDLNRVILVDWQALRTDVPKDIHIAAGDPPQEKALAYPVLEAQSQVSKSLTERPPLGWNSYDCYGTSFNVAQYKACVDVLVEKRLHYVYHYAVIDAAWHRKLL